jgi:hypothetical protein
MIPIPAECHCNRLLTLLRMCSNKIIDPSPVRIGRSRIAIDGIGNLRSHAPEVALYKSKMLIFASLIPPISVEVPVRIVPRLALALCNACRFGPTFNSLPHIDNAEIDQLWMQLIEFRDLVNELLWSLVESFPVRCPSQAIRCPVDKSGALFSVRVDPPAARKNALTWSGTHGRLRCLAPDVHG